MCCLLASLLEVFGLLLKPGFRCAALVVHRIFPEMQQCSENDSDEEEEEKEEV